MSKSIDMFVITYRGYYLRFGSYGMASLVAHPAKATLYSRVRDAYARRNGRAIYAVIAGETPDVEIPREKLTVCKVTLALVEQVPWEIERKP